MSRRGYMETGSVFRSVDRRPREGLMNRKSLARCLSTLAALLIAGAASAADVHVMISAGFFGVYSELGPAFERASGHRLVTTRGPSMGDSPEAIPARLARGETADVVILDGGAADELGRNRICARRQQGRAGALAHRDGGARRSRKAGHRQRGRAAQHAACREVHRVLGQRQRHLSVDQAVRASSASPMRSRARAERCADRRRASRLPRSSRAARRRSASSRSPS